MAEPQQSNWIVQVFVGTLSTFVAVIGGILKYFQNKLDKLEDRQKGFLTREELEVILYEYQQENKAKHEQNIQVMNNLTQRIDRVLERL
jgi:hypothetical protein